MINPPSRNKYQYWTGPAPKGDGYGTWLKTGKEHPGSWWPHWQAWIEKLDDEQVKAAAGRRRQVQADRGRARQLRAGQGLTVARH